MMLETRATIIIPAYNEEKNIAATLKSLEGLGIPADIIVVDDGSRDRTAAVAREAGARVIQLQANMGKGRAMEEGLKEAAGPVVAFLDADLGETAVQAKKLLEPVMAGKADLAVARWPDGKGRSGFGLAQGLARWGIKKLTGFGCSSPLSGQRALRKDFLTPLEGGFGVEVGMTVDALRKGARMQEIPVDMRHRATGRDFSGFKHRGRQFCCVAGVLAKRFLGGVPWK